MAEEKRFVLYEYLSYFWKRKWFFVILPIITAVVAAGLAYVLNDKEGAYTGEAVVFVGNVNAKELTNDDIIKAKYKDDVPELDVFVSQKGHVKFTVQSASREDAQQKLDSVVSQYVADLKANAKERIDISGEYLDVLKKRSEALRGNLDMYERQLVEENPPVDEYNEYHDLIQVTETELTQVDERINRIGSDIALFEHPQEFPSEVYPQKTYIPEGAVIGLILGLILATGLLTLMKYLADARAYYRARR